MEVHSLDIEKEGEKKTIRLDAVPMGTTQQQIMITDRGGMGLSIGCDLVLYYWDWNASTTGFH